MLTGTSMPTPLVPYDMFDHARTEREVSAARNLSRIYHTGQERAWDGRALLAELLEAHGPVELPAAQRRALRRILATIFWGELAAWKVSAALALEIEPLEAKMAATAQAHDEARHFYVLHDYLALLGYEPGPLPASADAVLQMIIRADSLAKKLVGMQMMVEPIALTIFQMIRTYTTEPVLCELLRYFERDEARHVALGVNYLPRLLRQLSHRELASYYVWQLRLIRLEIAGMRELEEDFRALGFPPREVFRLGQAKQLLAARHMAAAMGRELPTTELLRRISQALLEYHFPESPQARSTKQRLLRAVRALTEGELSMAEAAGA